MLKGTPINGSGKEVYTHSNVISGFRKILNEEVDRFLSYNKDHTEDLFYELLVANLKETNSLFGDGVHNILNLPSKSYYI